MFQIDLSSLGWDKLFPDPVENLVPVRSSRFPKNMLRAGGDICRACAASLIPCVFNFKHIELFPHIHGVSLVLFPE